MLFVALEAQLSKLLEAVDDALEEVDDALDDALEIVDERLELFCWRADAAAAFRLPLASLASAFFP